MPAATRPAYRSLTYFSAANPGVDPGVVIPLPMIMNDAFLSDPLQRFLNEFSGNYPV
jgi:hypothetical protein